MSKFIHVFKKYWITIWLVIAIICTTTFVSYAEYIKDSNRAKRVVANTTGAGALFSSDYLTVGTGAEYEVQYNSALSHEYEVPIRIWNYDSSNPTFFYDSKNITYDLVAQLVTKFGNSYVPITSSTALSDPDNDPSTSDAISIQIKMDIAGDVYTSFTATPEADNTVTITGTDTYTVSQSFDSTDGYMVTYSGLKLYKRSRDENKVIIKFPESIRTSNDKIYVKLTATPTPLSDYSGISQLNGFITVTKGKTALSQGWSGDFSDSEENTDYDGFNYVISGNGTATLTFKWRSDKLEINPYFLSANLLTIPNAPTVETIGGDIWKSITINADSSIVNRYDIQLFMKDWSTNTVNWSNVINYVEFSES